MKHKKTIKINHMAGRKVTAFCRSSVSGQSLVEYVILMFFLSSLSISIMRSMNRITQTGFQTMAAEIEKSLVTGSFDVRPGQDIHQVQWAK